MNITILQFTESVSVFFRNGSLRFSHHDTGDGREIKWEKGMAKRGRSGKTWTTQVLASPCLWRRPHLGSKMILVLQTTKERHRILCIVLWDVVGGERDTTLQDTGQHSELTMGSTAPADTPATQFLYLRPQRTLKKVERDWEAGGQKTAMRLHSP